MRTIVFTHSDHLLLAATTYDICKLLGEVNALAQYIKIITLLQPPPETFALFDDLILLSEGQVIYSGPVEKVVPYFESLGYKLPDRMDAADWLQVSLELFEKFHIYLLQNSNKTFRYYLFAGITDKRWSRVHRSRRSRWIRRTTKAPNP